MRKKFEAGQTASLTGLSIILFFTLLALAHGDALVALSGCALCLIHILVRIEGEDFLCDLCDYLATFAVNLLFNRKGR